VARIAALLIALALAAPAHAVYHLAGTFDLDATTQSSATFAVDPQGNVFVLNKSAPWVTGYSATGQRLGQFGSADQLDEPKAIATDPNGGVFVLDKARSLDDGNRVQVFSSGGGLLRTIMLDQVLYSRGQAFAVDGTGHLFISDDETKIFDGSGKYGGTISYGKVDAVDAGALAGVPSGSGVYGRSNTSQGEAVFVFDAGGTELAKLSTPSASDTSTSNWHPDRLAANAKGELIILDTYCQAVVVHKGPTLTDAAYVAGVLTPGQKAGLRAVGSDAAGDIFVLIGWGDGSFHVARLVPGSGTGNLPRKACRDLPGGGGSTTTPPAGGGTTNPPATNTASPQFYVPPQTLQNRTFLVGLSCQSACGVTVSAAAVLGGKRYGAGRRTKQLAAGSSKTIELTVPKRTYRRIVRRLQAGKVAKLRVSLRVAYSDGRIFSKKVTLPLNPA
jgi:hypothetical protein